MSKDYDNMTSQELEALLKKKRAQERDAYEAKKQEYENKRDQLVNQLVFRAIGLHDKLAAFKQLCVAALEEFRKDANTYGDIRSNSKGGFSLRDNSGEFKIAYERNTKSEYDERSELAEELLRDFLSDMVKKRDAKAYELITGLLERGKKGDFNPASIAALLKMEDKFEDDRWIRAMQLFKESFVTKLISMNVAFFRKDDMGKDIIIPLNFSSISLESDVIKPADSTEK